MNRAEYLNGCAYLKAPRGHQLPQTKLNEEQVRIARSYTTTARELAERWGVHIRTVEKVRVYGTWRHVR